LLMAKNIKNPSAFLHWGPSFISNFYALNYLPTFVMVFNNLGT
jgi:hypothetical protein